MPDLFSRLPKRLWKVEVTFVRRTHSDHEKRAAAYEFWILAPSDTKARAKALRLYRDKFREEFGQPSPRHDFVEVTLLGSVDGMAR
ncbi:MAG TPA: hypothetical protein VIV12_17145 [Streptosporangiaceae bacterium]